MKNKFYLGIIIFCLSPYMHAMDHNLQLPSIDESQREDTNGAAEKQDIKSLSFVFSNDDYSLKLDERILEFARDYKFFATILRKKFSNVPAKQGILPEDKEKVLITTFRWSVSSAAAKAFESLLNHFKINELWSHNKPQAELLVLDLMRWIEDNEKHVTEVAAGDTGDYISALAKDFESSRLSGGVLLAARYPETRIPHTVLGFIGIGGNFGQSIESLKYDEDKNKKELYSANALIFVKKLFHLFYNVRKRFNVDFEFLNADNCPEESEIKIIDAIKACMLRENLQHADYFFEVFELAQQWNLKTVKHAITRILAETFTDDCEKKDLDDLIASIPFHLYPGLLKNKENVPFIIKLLNHRVQTKTASGLEQTILTDCLDVIIDCIESIDLKIITLHPVLEELLHERFNNKIPLSSKKKLCDLSAHFGPGMRIVSAYEYHLNRFIALRREDGQRFLFPKDGKKVGFDSLLGSLFAPHKHSIALGSETAFIVPTEHGIIYRGEFIKPLIMHVQCIPTAVTYYKEESKTFICAGCKDGGIRIFNTHTETLFNLRGPSETRCIKMTTSPSTIIALFNDASFQVWEKDGYKLLAIEKIPSSAEIKIMKSLSTGHVAFGCSDGTVCVFDSALWTDKPFVIDLKEEIAALEVICTNYLLIGTQSGRVMVVNMKTGKVVPVTQGPCNPVLFISHDADCETEILYANGLLEKCFISEIRPLKDLDFLRLGDYFYAQKTQQAYERAFRCFTRAQSSVNAEAAEVRLAEMHLYGHGTKQNLKNAYDNAHFTLDPESEASMCRALVLGELALVREGYPMLVKTDEHAFLELCRVSADRYFDSGEFGKAFGIYPILAIQNLNTWSQAWAWYRLGMLLSMTGTAQADYTKAKEYFEKAAEQYMCESARINSLRQLIAVYELGRGVKRDLEQANKYKIKVLEPIDERMTKKDQAERERVMANLLEMIPVGGSDELGLVALDAIALLQSVARNYNYPRLQARACLHLLKMALFEIDDLQLRDYEFASYIKICVASDDTEIQKQAEVFFQGHQRFDKSKESDNKTKK